jgi:methionyl-tRNA formyltransferase
LKTERLKFVFMGSDPIAIPLLDWLIADGSQQVELAVIYTQPDRAVGRGQRVAPNAIKRWATEHNIRVRQPDRLTGTERAILADDAADAALVMAYGHILREAFINTPRLGTLNLHASLLPAYRGASPIQSAIASGDRETGVSLMRIVRELDAGPVADVERLPIAATDTAIDVETKMAAACIPLVARNLAALQNGSLQFVEQHHAAASFCRKLTKADGVLDFRTSAPLLAARINGLHPWPGCRINYADQVIRIGGARVATDIEANGVSPGTVLASTRGRLIVATGERCLELSRLQRPGGRMLPGADFLRGFSMAEGSRIESQPMPELVTRPEL